MIHLNLEHSIWSHFLKSASPVYYSFVVFKFFVVLLKMEHEINRQMNSASKDKTADTNSQNEFQPQGGLSAKLEIG